MKRDRLLKHIWSHCRKFTSAGAQVPLRVMKEGGGGRGGSNASPTHSTCSKTASRASHSNTHCSLAWEGQLQASILLLPKPWVRASLSHGTSQSKTKTPSPQPAVYTPCLLLDCHQACRCGNSPCHSSQQYPAPSPLGEGNAGTCQASKSVLGSLRPQEPHSDTAKGIFVLCQIG